MAENEQTKICPLCAETIKAKVKLCPYCRKIQSKWIFITRYDLLAVITLCIFVGTIFLLFQMFASGRNFSSSRDKVEVLNSQLGLDGWTNVVVSGVLTNGSNYSWQMGEFEVRFFDGSGKLIDADEGSDSFTVLPHDDHSFKITLYRRKSISEYASQKVLIRSASDPDASWFAGD